MFGFQICQFDIKLDNDDSPQPGLFLSGTFISGQIILDVAKPTSIVREYLRTFLSIDSFILWQLSAYCDDSLTTSRIHKFLMSFAHH